MNTNELESNLRMLDGRAKSLGNEIFKKRADSDGYVQRAAQNRTRAEELQSLANTSEDGEQYAQLLSQASACRNEAERLAAIAAMIENEIASMKGALYEIKGLYGSYMEEGKKNLGNLHIAAEKLLSAGSGRYGTSGLQAALQETRGRIVYNENLIKGCQSRIAWIDQVCGSAGTPHVKTLKYR